ncbi:MAG: phosphate acyltransferase PlsX [Armatimonadota bacterium]
MSIVIAVDAMGGDNAPAEVVRGAVAAAKGGRYRVILVGEETKLKEYTAAVPGASELEIVPAPEVIDMHEAPAAAVRRKRRCSLAVAACLVRDGQADAFVSAGNSGACMASAAVYLGMLEGVDRPAIAAVLPTRLGRCVLVDSGAVVDCDPDMLVQFAVMGQAYARAVLGNPKPRVGILSIGEEDSKGNSLTKAAAELLRSVPAVNFVGNVEGNTLFQGKADVVVCDGFVGNIVLKTSEGVAEMITGYLRDSLKRSLLRRCAALLLRPAWKGLRTISDYAEHGGAPLLGVKGVCIIAHGRSNARAVANAIKAAGAAASANLVNTIQRGLLESGLAGSREAKAV